MVDRCFLPDANIKLLKLAAKQFLKITLGVNKQNPTCEQECYFIKKALLKSFF